MAREKLLIYCATPTRLVEKKQEIMDFVTAQGHGPFHPFQAFEPHRFENGPIGRDRSMEFCLRAIEICDEFWLFGISDGTLQELCHAQKLSKLIRVYLNEFDPNWLVAYKRLAPKYNFPIRDLFEQGLVGGHPPDPL